MHEQVRQDRRYRRSLRSSLGSLRERAVGVLQRRSQPPLDIQQHPPVGADRGHRLDDKVPRNGVEELPDVQVDHPVVLPTPCPACSDRVMGRLSRPIAIGVRVELRFHQRLQMHGHHRLRDPVCDRRHPEHPDPAAMRLGDLNRPDRRRKVGPRTHPIPDPVQVALQIGLKLVQVLPVHPRRALIGPDPPIRLPDQRLGNHKRLVLELGHADPRFLPGPSGPG